MTHTTYLFRGIAVGTALLGIVCGTGHSARAEEPQRGWYGGFNLVELSGEEGEADSGAPAKKPTRKETDAEKRAKWGLDKSAGKDKATKKARSHAGSGDRTSSSATLPPPQASSVTSEIGLPSEPVKVVPADFSSAMALAAEGDLEAARVVGDCYRTGTGTEKNINEAWKWYARAAGSGNLAAQYEIANMYRDGDGVRQSDVEAAYWWRKAASNGHPEATLAIADCFATGTGVLADQRVAAENYWRAAERGIPAGAYRYALMLRDGIGVDQNLPRALKYFNIAAKAGYADSADLAKALADKGVKEAPARTPRAKTAPETKAGKHTPSAKHRKSKKTRR